MNMKYKKKYKNSENLHIIRFFIEIFYTNRK